MKKLLVAILSVLFAAPSFAQFSSGGFSLSENNMYYGIRIGMNIANLSGDSQSMDSKVGLTLGGVIGFRLSDVSPVCVESGVYFSGRGAKKDKINVGYNCLDIPLVVKYGFHATDEVSVIPFFGPVFSYAVSGKTKQPDMNGGYEKVGSFDEKKAFTGGLKRANMGLKLGCGAEYNNIYLEAGYQFGVSNIAKYDDYSIHSNALFLNFGVNF